MTARPKAKPTTGPKEKKFIQAIRDLFVGANVDGQSGYINLMRIKAAYYEKQVGPQLMEDIEIALKPFPEFREELFDKLHAYFSRYFSKSGSICFAYTPQHMSVYEKVYTDEQDVVLFWKTHMLYYVKTDRLFKDLKVEQDDEVFFFDCTALEHKKNNEKRALVFTFDKVEKDGTIRLSVTYSERGRITKTDEILKALKNADHPIKEAELAKALRVFEKQSEVDYFINKDARGFLREQFDLWMYQYLFKDETEWNTKRIAQLQVLKITAFKLIDFIAQFEDELVRIWNKPKFIRGSFYIITLDRIAAKQSGVELIAEFIKHPGMEAQVAEWIDLGMIDKKFDPKQILTGKANAKELATGWKYLPLDTRHFKSLELKLLSLFEDLDEELDGRLYKSENYQALNTIQHKFKGRVKCCYIDPPYNTGGSGFPYSDAFKHASWASMIDDRLELSKRLLANNGTLYSSIDHNERHNLEALLNKNFGNENRVEELIWATNATKNQSPTYSTNHEYVEVYARSLKKVSSDPRIFREPKPGFAELTDLVEKLNPDYPSIEKIEEEIQKLFKEHREEFRAELEELGVEYDKNLDLWKGLYNYSKAEYRDSQGEYVPESQAKKNKAKIWIWRESDPSMPQVKEDSQKKEFRNSESPAFRFYKPLHPQTKKPSPHPKTGWRFPFEDQEGQANSFNQLADDNRIAWGVDESKVPQVKRFLHEVDTNVAKSLVLDYTDGEKQLSHLFGASRTFPNPKPTTLISRFILQTTDENEWVMDYFAGSGTTAHSVVESYHTDRIKRKFLVIDTGEYFESILIPRVKKVFSAKTWKSGKPVALDGPGLFCKVSSLEQYEDALSASVYFDEDGQDLFRNTKTDTYSQYVFFRDLKMGKALELDYEKNEVNVDLTRLYDDIDLAETLSCVTGKWIKRITEDEVEFADGSKESLKKPDWKLLKPLIFWGPVV